MAEPTLIQVGVHVGNVLQYLAQTYGTGYDVLREAVQNAIDEGAKNILIKVDCTRHNIQVFDDGDGASKAEIEAKFSKIGLSLKLGQAGAIGQKGIGNLAGLAVAERWQLITRDTHRQPIWIYTFERKELTKDDRVQLQCEEVEFKEITGAPFRVTSLLRLQDVSEVTLRQLGDKETIERTLRETFNVKLKNLKINLRVSYKDKKGQVVEFVVRPTLFRGTAMEAVDYDTEFGIVTFEFSHSPTVLDKPTVLVVHQGVYSLPLINFFKLRILPAELEPLFARGYFEGQIHLGFCTLNSSRSAFEHNKELQTFVQTVESFAREVLEPLTEQFAAADRDERLKRIAEAVLHKMQQFFSRHPHLLPPNLKFLRLTEGVDEMEKERVTRIKKPRVPLPSDTLRKQREETRRRKPDEKLRRRVLDVVSGMTIQYVNPDPDEGFSWHSRITSPGVIQVNDQNNEFTAAERAGRSVLERYLTLLVQKELTCASLSPPEAKAFDQSFEKFFLSFWRASLLE